jgi:hypothetical protein
VQGPGSVELAHAGTQANHYVHPEELHGSKAWDLENVLMGQPGLEPGPCCNWQPALASIVSSTNSDGGLQSPMSISGLSMAFSSLEPDEATSDLLAARQLGNIYNILPHRNAPAVASSPTCSPSSLLSTGSSSGQLAVPSGQISVPSGQISVPAGKLRVPDGQPSVQSEQAGVPGGQLSVSSGQSGVPSGQLSNADDVDDIDDVARPGPATSPVKSHFQQGASQNESRIERQDHDRCSQLSLGDVGHSQSVSEGEATQEQTGWVGKAPEVLGSVMDGWYAVYCRERQRALALESRLTKVPSQGLPSFHTDLLVCPGCVSVSNPHPNSCFIAQPTMFG